MSNYQLVKNTEWKEVEINGEEKEIPINWKVKNISQVSFCWDNKRKPLNQTERSNKKGNIPYWGANNIVDYVNDYLVDEEVVLLGEDAAPFYDKTKKVAFVSNEKIWPNNHIHVLKPLINSYFLMTVLNAVQYEKIIGTDSRPKLTQGMMNSIEFSYPSEKEQSAIASILSEQESVIENIEQLIQKYESRFQYLSDELLSGILRVKEVDGEMVLYKNPDDNWKEVEINGEMKEIPSDWEVNVVNKLFEIQRGKVLSKDYIQNNSGEYPVYSSATENDGCIGKIKTYMFDGEYLTWNTDGYAGSVFYRNGKFNCTNICGILKAKDKMNLHAFKFFLEPRFKKNVIHGGQLTNLKLMSSHVEGIELAYPENQELELISTIFNQQESLIDEQKQMLQQEKQKFDWLLDNLLSGKYLIKEN